MICASWRCATAPQHSLSHRARRTFIKTLTAHEKPPGRTREVSILKTERPVQAA